MTLSKETIGNVIEKLEHFAQNLKWTDVRGAQDLLSAADGLRELLERRERDWQEPVAWIVHARTGDQLTQDGSYVANAEGMSGIGSTPLYSAPPAPVEPAAYEIIAEAWRLMDGQNPETSEWHTVASRYLNAYRTARATISNPADIAIDEESQSFGNSEQLNSPVAPACWCRTCRPVNMADMRFVVCPECGNKRCPKANDHHNACSGSNEPGQDGSAYPRSTEAGE